MRKSPEGVVRDALLDDVVLILSLEFEGLSLEVVGRYRVEPFVGKRLMDDPFQIWYVLHGRQVLTAMAVGDLEKKVGLRARCIAKVRETLALVEGRKVLSNGPSNDPSLRDAHE